MNKTSSLYALIWLSRPLMQAAESLVEANLQGTGLTVRQRAVLEILLAQGPLSVPDLARALHIQRQYVQVMVNETQAEGLTDNAENPRHRRSRLITLTPHGESRITAIRDAEMTRVTRMAEGFEAGELAVATSVAERLLAAMQAEKEGQR